MKLTQDQRETLQALDKDQWAAIESYCKIIVGQFAERVLSAQPEKLVVEQSKYIGANALAGALTNARFEVKEKKK